MILANATHEEIARDLLASPKDVEAYEKIFFDVRRFLNNEQYLRLVLLRPSRRTHGQWIFEDIVWKLIGKTMGVNVLREIVNVFNQNTEAEHFITHAINNKQLQDVWTALHNREPNRFNENEIMEQYHRFQEIDDKKAKKPEGEGHMNLILSTLSNSLELASPLKHNTEVEYGPDEDLVRAFRSRLKEADDSSATAWANAEEDNDA